MKISKVDAYTAFDGKVFIGDHARRECEEYEFNAGQSILQSLKDKGIFFIDCYRQSTYAEFTESPTTLIDWCGIMSIIKENASESSYNRFFKKSFAVDKDRRDYLNPRFMWRTDSKEDAKQILEYIQTTQVQTDFKIPPEPFDIIGKSVVLLTGERNYDTGWIVDIEEWLSRIKLNINSAIDPVLEIFKVGS